MRDPRPLLLLLPLVIYIGLPRVKFRRGRDVASLLLRITILSLIVFAVAGVQIVRGADRLAVVYLVDVSDSVGQQAQEEQVAYIRESLESMRPDDQAAVIVFGGLTLASKDETFIKVKLTVLNALFGLVLGAGLLRGKSLLKALLGSSLRLTDAGWRSLTLRFTLYFFFLAGLNEVLRRTLSTPDWVTFKVFGVLGATFLFTLLQAPLIQKHALAEGDEPGRGPV